MSELLYLAIVCQMFLSKTFKIYSVNFTRAFKSVGCKHVPANFSFVGQVSSRDHALAIQIVTKTPSLMRVWPHRG